MRLNILFLIFFTMLILGATYALNQPQKPSVKEVPVPTTEEISDFPEIPFFSFNSIRDIRHDITDFEGKVILLNFWASWCAPCLVEFPKLMELAKQEPDRVVILAISVDQAKSNIPDFIEKLDEASQAQIKEDNVVIGWDPQQEISYDLFQTIRYPETYIIGPDLTLRTKVIGADVDFSSQEFTERLPLSEATPSSAP